MWHQSSGLPLQLRETYGLWTSSGAAQLPYRRRGMPKMPLLDREAVLVRQANAQESALLDYRCSLWGGMWPQAQMRITYLSQDLSSTKRMRRCWWRLHAGLWQAKTDLRAPLRGPMPCALPLQGGQVMPTQDTYYLPLSASKARNALQRIFVLCRQYRKDSYMQ